MSFTPPAQIPIFPSTLTASQSIPSGYAAILYGPVTVPSGVTLTVAGSLTITNLVKSGA